MHFHGLSRYHLSRLAPFAAAFAAAKHGGSLGDRDVSVHGPLAELPPAADVALVGAQHAERRVSAPVRDPERVVPGEHPRGNEEGAHVVGAQAELVRLLLEEALADDADRLAVRPVDRRKFLPDAGEHRIGGRRLRARLLPPLKHTHHPGGQHPGAGAVCLVLVERDDPLVEVDVPPSQASSLPLAHALAMEKGVGHAVAKGHDDLAGVVPAAKEPCFFARQERLLRDAVRFRRLREPPTGERVVLQCIGEDGQVENAVDELCDLPPRPALHGGG